MTCKTCKWWDRKYKILVDQKIGDWVERAKLQLTLGYCEPEVRTIRNVVTKKHHGLTDSNYSCGEYEEKQCEK